MSESTEIDIPDIRSSFGDSSAVAALYAVAEYYDAEPLAGGAFEHLLEVSQVRDAHPSEVEAAARDIGLTCKSRMMDAEMVRKSVEAGVPVLCCAGKAEYGVVVGVIKNFDESKHPRDHGKFAEKEGSSRTGDSTDKDTPKADKKRQPPKDDPVHGYLESFQDTEQTPVTAKDARQANKDLRGEGSKWRIVPDGKGGWEAAHASDLADNFGSRWVVSDNPLTGMPDIGEPDWFEQAREMSGDSATRGYLPAFNDPTAKKPTEEEVSLANDELASDGSPYRLKYDEDLSLYVAVKRREQEKAYRPHRAKSLAVRKSSQPITKGKPDKKTDSGSGHWITIGGSKGEDGKRHGGSPVYIENGKITRGAPSLTGKKLDNLKEPAESQGHRRELNQSKEHDRAVWGKKARKEGIDPKDLYRLADEVMAHDREHVEQRKRLLKDTRELLTKYGYDARSLTTNLRKGTVEDNIPKMDLVSRTMAERYPEQFAGDKDALDSEQRLIDLLTEGNPETIDSYSAYQHALDHLRDLKEAEPTEEDDPYSFDFGANKKGIVIGVVKGSQPGHLADASEEERRAAFAHMDAAKKKPESPKQDAEKNPPKKSDTAIDERPRGGDNDSGGGEKPKPGEPKVKPVRLKMEVYPSGVAEINAKKPTYIDSYLRDAGAKNIGDPDRPVWMIQKENVPAVRDILAKAAKGELSPPKDWKDPEEKVNKAKTETVTGEPLASLSKRAISGVTRVEPLSPEEYHHLPPVVLEKTGDSYDIVDGYHRLAGLASWAEKNGVSLAHLSVKVVVATDPILIQDAAEPGPKQDNALRKIYKQAGIKY